MPPSIPASLDALLRPTSIAIVGASTNPQKYGHMYLGQLLEFGFPGKIYAVNPRGGEVIGHHIYSSVKDIPDTVDYVISTVPAQQLLHIIPECAKKGARIIQMFTAQLSETGDPEAIKLEKEIIQMAHRLGLRIMGPNCMGPYYPKAGLTFRYGLPRESGKLGFISQSAGNGAEVLHRGTNRGLRFSKAISYGNGADITETELLEHLLHDPETEIIAAYIEGIKDKRFAEIFQRAASTKPVIVLKSGKTEAGARSAASHTASLVGDYQVWQTFVRQSNAIEVDSMEEMVDVLVAFYFLPRPKGKNVWIIGGGGGSGTLASDHLERLGIPVPPMPQEVMPKLQSLLRDDWTMVRNPFDLPLALSVGWSYQQLQPVLKSVIDSSQYHLFIADTAEWLPESSKYLDHLPQRVDSYLEVARTVDKPFAFIIRSAEHPEEWYWRLMMAQQRKCIQAGFPTFSTIPAAARALRHYLDYYLSQ